MSASITKRMAGIHHFLEQEILPDVGGEKRSELRAALKLFATLSDEIDVAHVRLADEARTMIEVAGAALSAGPELANTDLSDCCGRLGGELAIGPATLSDLESLHRRVRSLIADVVVQLSERHRLGTASHETTLAIAAIYRQLGADALARMPFQSVFQDRLYPTNKKPSGEPL